LLHESTPSPPIPIKDDKTTPHGSQIDKGKQPITSSNVAKSSYFAQSKIKLGGSVKGSLDDIHLEVAKLEENKSQYEEFIKERE
jgi:hypothetical protein